MHGATGQEMNQNGDQRPMAQDDPGGALRLPVDLRLAVDQRQQAVERKTPRVDGQVDVPGEGVQEAADGVRAEGDYGYQTGVEGAVLFGLVLLADLVQS